MSGMLGVHLAVTMLSDAEIANRLRNIKLSRGRGRVPVASVARYLGLSRVTVYKYINRGRVPEKRRHWLSVLLRDLEHRALSFERRKQAWQKVRRTPPDPLPPPQSKMMRADEWNEWAQCSTCASRSWHHAYHGARELIVCARCIPENQFPALGYSSSPAK